jgi:pimeloyl-ACP methyl ester carboxylesterase
VHVGPGAATAAVVELDCPFAAAPLLFCCPWGFSWWRCDVRDYPGYCSASFGLINVPVDICAGTLDTLIPEPNLREMAACLPNSTYTIFPNRGHLDFTIVRVLCRTSCCTLCRTVRIAICVSLC